MSLSPNLQSQVAKQLRQRILSGRLLPGTALREQSFAQEFGISRGPVRDAFLTLSKEGLLLAKPNVGVKVAAGPSVLKRSVIVQMRRDIEATAVAAWFENRDPKLLKLLSANLVGYEIACRAGDLDPVVELDMEFHQLIVASADEGSLLDLWRPVILQMFLRYTRHHTLLDSYAEHMTIFEAMKSGNGAAAIEALRRHIQ
jgi:DNA-binding GntR family transcriptional regulator